MRKIDIEGKLYLFPSLVGQAQSLVISSHGGQFPFRGLNRSMYNNRIDKNGDYGYSDYFYVPQGTTLHYYIQDGLPLPDPGIGAILRRKTRIIESINPGNISRDYYLFKYQESDKKPKTAESYRSIARDLTRQNEFAQTIKDFAGSTDPVSRMYLEAARNANLTDEAFDVLTIRKRYSGFSSLIPHIKLSTVIDLLERNECRYAHIHCVFCRCPIIG